MTQMQKNAKNAKNITQMRSFLQNRKNREVEIIEPNFFSKPVQPLKMTV